MVAAVLSIAGSDYLASKLRIFTESLAGIYVMPKPFDGDGE